MVGELVLLHGFTHTGRSWAHVVAEVGERYRPFAPDLPGHGGMAWRRPCTPGAVVAYLRALPAERFVLCGYSMGARLALRAALDLPGRVSRLVLISGTAGIVDAAARRARLTEDLALADRIQALPLARFVEEWSSQALFRHVPRALADEARGDRMRNEPAGLAAAVRGMGQGATEPMWDRLPSLSMPVIALAGERDEKYAELAGRMAEATPSGRAVIVPGAGHALHLEAPHAVAEAIVGA